MTLDLPGGDESRMREETFRLRTVPPARGSCSAPNNQWSVLVTHTRRPGRMR